MRLEDILLRAALIHGLGADAAPIARRLAAIHFGGDGRSCVDGGAPIQFTAEAPAAAAAQMRVGVRVADALEPDDLQGLVSEQAAQHLADITARTPLARHRSLGTWLFWSPERTSLYMDMRDPAPDDAILRVQAAVGPTFADQVSSTCPRQAGVRPWTLRLDIDSSGPTQAKLLWAVHPSLPIEQLAEEVAPGSWPEVERALGHLVRRPHRSGRFTIEVPLDNRARPGLRIASTGWALVPEDDNKRRSLAKLFDDLSGPRDQAEALWSLCRIDAPNRWRVGRACEVRVADDGIRARLLLVPAIDPAAI